MSSLPQPTEQPQIKTYDARDLLENEKQVCLVLDDQQYFLRMTRAGKLILTK